MNEVGVVSGVVSKGRVVQRGPETHVRRISTGKKGWEGGLRPAGGCNGAHRHAPDEAHEEEQGEVATPPSPKGAPESVTAEAQQRPFAH